MCLVALPFSFFLLLLVIFGMQFEMWSSIKRICEPSCYALIGSRFSPALSRIWKDFLCLTHNLTPYRKRTAGTIQNNGFRFSSRTAFGQEHRLRGCLCLLRHPHWEFDPYSDPYHGKIGQHTLTSIKILSSKKSPVCNAWRYSEGQTGTG